MDFLKIVLVPYGRQEFLLPKAYIQQYLAESIINQALMEEPTLEQLEINQPVVTPEFMTFLVNLSQGIEPEKSNYKINDVHKYLNTPGLLYYADFNYDFIPNRANPNDDELVERFEWIF